MKTQTVTSQKGDISLIADLALPLRTGSDLLEVLMNSPSETVALKASDLDAAFFDLKTGIAGDMLQKVSNYRMRLVILGDFAEVESRSLQDFIRESNQQGKVVFTETLDEAIAKLK